MKRFVLGLTALVIAGVAAPAQAGFTTFTSRAAFNAAAGTLNDYDFNSDATGDFTSKDFGDFTVSESETVLIVGVRSGAASTNVDGSGHLYFRETSTIPNRPPTTVTFDAAIHAFGFDYRTIDPTNDGLDLIIGGTKFTVAAGAPQSGFFGVISTAAFTSLEFRDDDDGGNRNDGVGLDNFSYGAVPEPTSLALWGLGAFGAAVRMRRRRRQV